MKKFLILLTLLFTLFPSLWYAWVKFNDASSATSKIKSVSMQEKWGSTETQLQNTAYNFFHTVKVVLGGLLVIYLVYAGVMMILSMWGDEWKLSEGKKWVWYAILWLLFVNIPWTLYNSFSGKRTMDDVTSTTGDTITIYQRNIFMNSEIFWSTLGSLITFLEIAIVAIAIFTLILQGIKIMSAWGEEDKVSEAKSKILWSVAGLIFIWVMEVWRNIFFLWDFKWQWQELFSKLANLALFFAGPIAIFFLSLAWYYYITSWGEEDKVKKAKAIVLNTVIATVILLGIYTLLLDLKTLTFK